jgi:hypothetical protein
LGAQGLRQGPAHAKAEVRQQSVYDLASALFSYTVKDHAYLVMLTSYFDESGRDPAKSRLMIVAGYVANVPRWLNFQQRWSQLTCRENVRALHRTDMESYWAVTAFKHWSREHQIEVIKQCGEVIWENIQHGFVGAVVYEDYERQTDTDKELLGSPYCLAAKGCFDLIVEWASSDLSREPIKVIFDQGMKNEAGRGGRGEVAEALTHYRPNIEDGGVGDKEKLNPLQAADFLAYEVWKNLHNAYDHVYHDGRYRAPRKSSYEISLGPRRASHYRFDSEGIAEYLKRARYRGF